MCEPVSHRSRRPSSLTLFHISGSVLLRPGPALVSYFLPRLRVCCSSLKGGLCGGRSLVVSETAQVPQPETWAPSWTPVSPSRSCSPIQVLPVLFLKWSLFTSLDLHCRHLAQAPTSSSVDYCSRACPRLPMAPLASHSLFCMLQARVSFLRLTPDRVCQIKPASDPLMTSRCTWDESSRRPCPSYSTRLLPFPAMLCLPQVLPPAWKGLGPTLAHPLGLHLHVLSPRGLPRL